MRRMPITIRSTKYLPATEFCYPELTQLLTCLNQLFLTELADIIQSKKSLPSDIAGLINKCSFK